MKVIKKAKRKLLDLSNVNSWDVLDPNGTCKGQCGCKGSGC